MLLTRSAVLAGGIVLPSYRRRAWQRSFWLVMSLGTGGLVAVLLWGLSVPERIASGLVGAALLAVPGLLRSDLAVLPMRAWNKLARLFARAATVWIVTVCLYVILMPLGRLGSSLRLAHPGAGGSLWTPWNPDQSGDKDDPSGIMKASTSPGGWLADFSAWARRPGNRWTWSLFPFLLILGSLESPRKVDAPPEGIYTLY